MKAFSAKSGAVALDLGATSARIAAGTFTGSSIRFELLDQVPHAPVQRGDRLEWDWELLLGLAQRAVAIAAERFPEATVGIDAWGVDHGFLDADGHVIGAPVCYRDPSHERAMRSIDDQQADLYGWTGIQRQPFNTLCQLIARRLEDPSLPSRATWLPLPDLLNHALGAPPHVELTQASTTQLLGLDGKWSKEAFGVAGWPVPALEPSTPGAVLGWAAPTVAIASVGSHDTASAVAGLGLRGRGEMFVNVGTWSLCGVVVDEPIATQAARQANFTNERCVDGRIRFLKNVPGFYVINRLHDELGIKESVPQWLAAYDRRFAGRVNLFDEHLFNPPSMPTACAEIATHKPESTAQWAALALLSLAETIAALPAELERIADVSVDRIRIAGGGSQSRELCVAVSDISGKPVLAGPIEATVLGNLAMQFVAQGRIRGHQAMNAVVRSSFEMESYEPSGS